MNEATRTATREPVRETLPNGLRVIVDERPSAATVAVQVTARAGTRDDAARPGLTPFTSAMIFQGTSRRPSESDLQREIARVGGSLNRVSSVELSYFSARVPARDVDLAFDLLADLALGPLFDVEALGRQQQISLQNLTMRRVNPGPLLEDLFLTNLFAGHPVGTPLAGTPESIEGIDREQLVEARRRRWLGRNLVLTVVGRILPEAAIAKAEHYFGRLDPGQANERQPQSLPPRTRREQVRGEAGQQQLVFRLGFPAPGLLHPDRYPLVVLDAMMSGLAGRLGRAIRTERGLAYTAGSSYGAYTDSGAWYAAAGVDPQNLEAALDATRQEIQRLREVRPDDAEVAGKIGQIAGSQILADEGNAPRASRLATQAVLGTEPVEEYVRRIRAVTPEDVQRVARTYLDPSTALVVVVGPPIPPTIS